MAMRDTEDRDEPRIVLLSCKLIAARAPDGEIVLAFDPNEPDTPELVARLGICGIAVRNAREIAHDLAIEVAGH